MSEHLDFLKAFIKKPLQIGAVAPSSPDLARAMISGLKPDEENIVLEIGCGTGAITRYLKDIIPTRKCYLGIEIEEKFVESLAKELPELKFINDDARKAEQLHINSGLGKVGYIISGLPFVSLNAEISEGILDEVDKFMARGAMFRTFQYAHGYYLPPAVKFRQRLGDRYGPVKKSLLIPKNIPPAYTLTWSTL
jgi:phospholipid N-methyltransferase